MANSRLFIEIGIDNDGKLAAIDRTPYEKWEEDIINHVIIERVLDPDMETVEMRAKELIHNRDYELVRASEPFTLIYDGTYIYQKLIMPLKGHEGNFSSYYDDGDFYLEGELVEFDDIWDNKENLQNVFWFDDKVFTMYKLIECFIHHERNRLNQIFATGCKINCPSSISATNADFLAATVYVVKHLIANERFMDAQAIIDRLNTCNGICKNPQTALTGCGCG